MDPFARIAETPDTMSERPRHLRLVEAPPPRREAPIDEPAVAFLHEWRAEQIARSKAMHPTNVARAMALQAAVRPLG
jgi:hypothetical protein